MYFTELKQAITANPSHLCCLTSGRQRKDVGRRILFQQLGPLTWCPGCASTANRFEACGEGEREGRLWCGETLGKNQNMQQLHAYVTISYRHMSYIYMSYIIYYCILYIKSIFFCYLLLFVSSTFRLRSLFSEIFFSQPLSTSVAWLHVGRGQIFVGCAAEKLHISHVSARHGDSCTPSGVV